MKRKAEQERLERERREAEQKRLEQERIEREKREAEAKRKNAEIQKSTSNMANGHEYVDLGLPSGLKWATCNVGANKPEDYGDYFAWGEVNTKSEYTEKTYKHYRGFLGINKYVFLGEISGNAQYDTARAKWGGKWRMPTKAELQELCDKCTWIWMSQNGVEGYKVTGPNGNSIFLPAAGYRLGSSLDCAGIFGLYWSSSPNDNIAYYLDFYSGSHGMNYGSRDGGLSVRPVLE